MAVYVTDGSAGVSQVPDRGGARTSPAAAPTGVYASRMDTPKRRFLRLRHLRYEGLLGLILAVAVAGCNGRGPTAPTPVIPPPVVVVPPVVTPPSPPPSTPAFPPADPRFDLAFYRLLVHDNGRPLQRFTRAPLVYLRTIDDTGRPVDARLLEQTAAAFINTVGLWAGGAFGIAGLERGTDTRENHPDWLTVKWSSSGVCGHTSAVGTGGSVITLNHLRSECTCGPLVAKHELGHALGYYHTDSDGDLMAATFQGVCDKPLSAREVYHAQLAYQRPVGSPAP
jgi:hypothetical protein